MVTDLTEEIVQRPRIFNTPFESGLRSVILLTACFPEALGLHQLVTLDHVVVHTEDFGGPPSLHPKEESRAAELLVRRRLVESGLALMGTRQLVCRRATAQGFRYSAGEEAGTFVDYLRSGYTRELSERALWIALHILPLSPEEFDVFIRDHVDRWAPEFQHSDGPGQA